MSVLQSILVVEDNDEDFETVVEAVRRCGINNPVRRAISGDSGLHMLQADVQAKSSLPVLVLLDLNTPAGDGRDALRQIKQDLRLRVIPTVVSSTSTNPRDVDFCHAHHANAYHSKPVSHPAHLRILQDIFSYWLASYLPLGKLTTKKS